MLLEKVQGRLKGWKAEKLSLGGRLFWSIQSSSAIPGYFMPSARVLKSIDPI
jgi:hypothetical protein